MVLDQEETGTFKGHAEFDACVIETKDTLCASNAQVLAHLIQVPQRFPATDDTVS